jgi:hypothetical protein
MLFHFLIQSKSDKSRLNGLAIIFIILTTKSANLFGQTPCVAPDMMINPYEVCSTNYEPVCGCNGITYTNECVARHEGKVTSYSIGACNTS